MAKVFIWAFLVLAMIGSVSAGLLDGLISYYPLDGASNLTDNHTQMYNITKYGSPTYVASCKLGGCYNLTGTGSVSVPTDMLWINFTRLPATYNESFTVSFWAMYPATIGANGYQFFFLGNHSANYPFATSIQSPTSYLIGTHDGLNSNSAAFTMTRDNQWHHYVFVNQNKTTLQIYEDGVQLVNSVVTARNYRSPTGFCFMGGGALHHCAYSSSATVPIDELGIWNKALLSAEISKIYNSGAGLRYADFGSATVTTGYIDVNSNNYSILRLPTYSVGVSNRTYDYNPTTTSWSSGLQSTTEYNYTLTATPAEGFVVLNFTNLSYTIPAYDVTGNGSNVQIRKEVNAVSARMLAFYNYSSGGMSALCGYAAVGCNYDSHHIEYYAKQRMNTTTNQTLHFYVTSELSNVSIRSNTTNSYLDFTYFDVANGSTIRFNYSVVNVSIRDTIANIILWNMTTNLENRDTSITLTNSTLSNQSVYYVEPGNYSISFTKSGYISQSMNISVGFGLNNVRFNTSPDNAVSLLFLDELNSSPQINVTFDIINDYFSKRIFMGTNTSLLLQSIPYGDYEFRYGVNSPTLQPRSYFISFPITTANLTNLTLRTINTTSSTLFIRNIVDATSQPMTGYVLDVQRFYTNGSTSTGAWETVSQAAIDQRGDAVFPAVPNTQAYRFRILNGSSIIDIFTPSYLVDQSSNFISKSSGSVLSNFKTAQNIGYTPIRNTSTQLVFDYSSATEINRICMDVLYEYRFNTSRVQACSTANSGTLASSIDPSRNGTYTATVYANVSGQIYTLDTIKYKPSGSGPLQTFGKYGLVIWLVSMLVAAIIGGFVNPIPGIVFAVTATIAYAASFIGLIQMSVTIAGGLLVTTIIILILFARKE